MKTVIVDVRTADEFNLDGHAEGSVNYPLDKIETYVDSLREFDKVILVCRSGNRANIARSILLQSGISNIENQGAWQNVSLN
ncbi:MAG: rhodanese-like domain-containing protein [Daejeonella sp.]|uniref:rhodanese-like domain-containing protein n=1 Tax=Daejeonella sp. TaxID=2805397 RepID=UPI0027354F0C|nr:rhodanese-like domain-containing protein [Daejeonella sp.]MDP3466876.1 rhodanese-like domain-containing protein [Daejeonella sp.]